MMKRVARFFALCVAGFFMATSAASALTITNGVSSNTTITSAWVMAWVGPTNGCGTNASVIFYYGVGNQGTNASSWASSSAVAGTFAPGVVSNLLYGLTPATKYYYRPYTYESTSTAWAVGTSNFVTLANAPTNQPTSTVHAVMVDLTGALKAPTNFFIANSVLTGTASYATTGQLIAVSNRAELAFDRTTVNSNALVYVSNLTESVASTAATAYVWSTNAQTYATDTRGQVGAVSNIAVAAATTAGTAYAVAEGASTTGNNALVTAANASNTAQTALSSNGTVAAWNTAVSNIAIAAATTAGLNIAWGTVISNVAVAAATTAGTAYAVAEGASSTANVARVTALVASNDATWSSQQVASVCITNVPTFTQGTSNNVYTNNGALYIELNTNYGTASGGDVWLASNNVFTASNEFQPYIVLGTNTGGWLMQPDKAAANAVYSFDVTDDHLYSADLSALDVNILTVCRQATNEAEYKYLYLGGTDYTSMRAANSTRGVWIGQIADGDFTIGIGARGTKKGLSVNGDAIVTGKVTAAELKVTANAGAGKILMSDANGNMTMTSPPSFVALSPSNQIIDSGAGNMKVLMTSVVENIGGYYDSANGRFLPPSGLYNFTVVYYVSPAQSGGSYDCFLLTNAAAPAARYLRLYGGGGNETVILNGSVRMNGVDYIEPWAYWSITSTNYSTNALPYYSWWEGHWVSP